MVNLNCLNNSVSVFADWMGKICAQNIFLSFHPGKESNSYILAAHFTNTVLKSHDIVR